MPKIFQRKDGLFVASVSMGFEVGKDGTKRRVRRTFYGATRAAVKAKLADATAREGGNLRRRVSSGSLGAWMTAWLDECEHHMAPASHANYVAVWRKAQPILGHKKLATFEPADVADLYVRLRRSGTTPSQLAKLRVVLHRAIEVASQRGLFNGRNPVGLVDPPKYAAKERTPLTLTQAQQVIEACVASKDRHEGAVVLAVTTGMRLGEILALKWSDVNWDEPSLTVRRSLQELNGHFSFSQGKTATARRKITLGEIALGALERRKAIAEHVGDDDLIFGTATGAPIARSNFRQRTFVPILANAGVPRVRFHDLRHSFASLLLQQGTPVKVAAEALGHANPGLTQRLYQHVIGDLQSQATKAIDEALQVNARKRIT